MVQDYVHIPMKTLLDKQSRYFSLIAYDDSETASAEYLTDMLRHYQFPFFSIKHDMDKNKLHYHFCVQLPNAQNREWLSVCLDFPLNLIEPCNYTAYRGYITHRDPKSIKAGKHQYNDSDVYDPYKLYLRGLDKTACVVEENTEKWNALYDALCDWVQDESPVNYISLFRYLNSKLDMSTFNSTQMLLVYKEAYTAKEKLNIERNK